ncbi:MAG: MATE family efflux transporter [Candidatus Aenigmatarchaeota archaeon]
MDHGSIYGSLKEKMGRPSKEEILEGDILSVLFKLAWPMMIASLLQTTYNLIDTIWLGRLPSPENTLSVAAISVAWPFVFLLLSVQMGLGIAGISMISQHTGAEEYDEAYHDTGQLFFLFLVISTILGGLGFLIAENFLSFLTQEAELVPYATSYLQIIFLGFPFLLLFAAFSFSLRAWGDTITPMLVMAVSVVLNIILDPVLIFGLGPFPRMGITGAAVATVSARGVGTAIAVYLLWAGKVDIKLKLWHLKPDLTKLKKFISVGLPATLARMEESVGFVLMTGLLAMLPMQAKVLAAYGIGSRVINITFIFLNGLMMAISTMVGQALGADLKGRAEKTTTRATLVMIFFMSLVSLTFIIFRYQIMRFFIVDEPLVIEIGARFLVILAIGGPFFAIYEGVSGALNGSGHTGQHFGLSLLRLWGLRIPLILLLAFAFALDSTGAWLAIGFSNVGAGTAAYWLYKKGWWKEKIIDKEPPSFDKLKTRFKRGGN